MEYGAWLKKADLDLREGRGSQIAEKLQPLKREAIPRRWRAPVARICWRAGLFAEGLKILTPIIYPVHKGEAPATEKEIAEYAVLLLKNGSTREASRWFDQLPLGTDSEVYLFKAFCQMAEWNYVPAAANLQLYLESSPSEYQSLVASVNMAACLVASAEYDAALELLNKNIAAAQQQAAHRLLGNSLELRAQVRIYRGEWSEAREDLESSSSLLLQDRSNDLLYVKKWQAILTAMQTGSLEAVDSVRIEARKRMHWESLRDLDRFRLRAKFDPALFDYLLFGTPFSPFRERVLRELNRPAPEKTYRWGAAEGPVIHVATGEITGDVDRGGGMERQVLNVLVALSRDFYRPARVGELFSALCPDQHFDIFTSHNRIAKILSRARQEFRQLDLPITIENQNGAHRLVMTGPVSLLLQYDRGTGADVVLEKLRRTFEHRRFSAHEACSALTLSRQRFQRWFKNAESAQKVEKFPCGALTEYRLKAG